MATTAILDAKHAPSDLTGSGGADGFARSEQHIPRSYTSGDSLQSQSRDLISPAVEHGISDAQHLRHTLEAYTLQPPTPSTQLTFPPSMSSEVAETSMAPDARAATVQSHHHRAGSAPIMPQRIDVDASETGRKSDDTPLEAHVPNQQLSARRRIKSAFSHLTEETDDNEGGPRGRLRHGRRASFVPGIDIGSAPLSAAPPAERPISVSIRPISLIDHPATQTGYFDPSPASVALARTNSLSSQGSTAFGFTGSRSPALGIAGATQNPSEESFFCPQSPVPPPPQSPGASTAEDVEPDAHPLYTLLSTSRAPRLRAAWQAARLVLLPPRETMPAASVSWDANDSDDEDLEEASWQDWVASHAFKATEEFCGQDREHFVSASNRSIAVEAIVDAANHEVQLSEASQMAAEQQRATSGPAAASPPSAAANDRLAASMPASPPSMGPSPLSTAKPSPAQHVVRMLPITSEVTIYRQRAIKASFDAIKPASTPTGKKEKRGLKAPVRWLRTVSKSRSSIQTASPQSVSEPVEEPLLERIRLLSVGGEVVQWFQGLQQIDLEGFERPPAHVDAADRSLLRDVNFFQHPPDHLAEAKESLSDALQDLIRLVHECASSFMHVHGYETYTLKRIRSRIMDPVWHTHLASLSRSDPTLFQRLENVVMGLCHEYLYTRVILPQHEPQNRYLDTVLAVYRARPLTLDDFSLSLSPNTNFREVFAILRSLNTGDLADSSQVDIDQLTHRIGDVDLVAALLRARTPLDLLTTLHRALEAVGNAVRQGASPFARGLTVDDYIPLLSFALVQADVKDLESLTYYMKSFVQSDLSPSLLWSQTTFDAAVAFLRTNPFFADVSRPASAAATPATEVPLSRVDSRLRRVSTMSTSNGPVLSVHRTSSPPKRSESSTSLPSIGREAVSPTTAPGYAFALDFDEALLSPTRGNQSSLFSRRMHSGKRVPTDGLVDVDMRDRRRLSASDGVTHRQTRRSVDDMPPPVFPASAGITRNRSHVSMDARLIGELAARLDELLPSASSVVLQPPTTDIDVRAQTNFRTSVLARQPSRSYHVAHDFQMHRDAASSRRARSPLNRTHSHHAATSQASSTDMRRSRSDGPSKSHSVDAWVYDHPPTSDRVASSERSLSPISSGASLERTLSITSESAESEARWSWNRQRLSSASSSSLLSSDGLSRRSSQAEPHGRARKNSVSAAADMLNRLHSSMSAVETSQSRLAHVTRRESTLSMSSMESAETNGSSGGTSAVLSSPPTLILAASHRRRQSSSRALRRDIMTGPSPLAPRQDNTNVISLPATYARLSAMADSLPSPIKEHAFAPAAPRDCSPPLRREAVFDCVITNSPEMGIASPTSPVSPTPLRTQMDTTLY